jgi:2-methylcitrate dehydratase PrpD
MNSATTAPDRLADLSHHLAHATVGLDYSRLPVVAADSAKKTVLDALGVTLAASGLEPAARPVIDLVRESGGRAEASVLGFGLKVPAVMAAFANGALAHCLNYDDQTPWGQHSSTSIVPAAFAVAERRGGVSGRDLIAAVAAGQDVFTRLRLNVDWRQDWNLSSVLGVFAATATAGRLLDLSHQQMINAWGLASMQSGGFMELISSIGSDIGGVYAGFSAKSAVVAALLAEKGATGVDSVFEGRKGFFATYFPGGHDRDAILEGLGVDYKGSATLYKPWAAVGTAHSHIHATLELMDEHHLDVDDIEEFRVFVGDCHEGLCAPLDVRRAPSKLMDARFSLPFLVAFAAVRRRLGVADLTQAALSDPRVRALAQRVVPISDSSLDWKLQLPNGRVEIVLRDGRRIEKVAHDVPGSTEVPMTWEDISRKFGECAAAATVPPSAGQIDRATQIARQLENHDDATDLIRALSVAPTLSTTNPSAGPA